ncbi:MAG: hypothetical protein JW929_02995 [Anaerolineales bacterium]|nr:hypothetical protein [Anaerolineales bacterium]
MEDRTLIAYSSKYGSTKKAAEAVADSLGACGLPADLMPVSKVTHPAPYAAFILGAPLYIGRWPVAFRRFLVRHQDLLSRRTLLIFTLGPTSTDPSAWEAARCQLKGELEKHPWLNVLQAELFGGRYDPSRLRFPDNLLAALPASPLHAMPLSDALDLGAVRTWTRDRAPALHPASPLSEVT